LSKLDKTLSAKKVLSEIKTRSNKFMKAFLNFGSSTPDNLNAFNQLEYGYVEKVECPGIREYGLKIKGKSILLADVMHHVENLNLPIEVQEFYSDLT
jgi:hypothetical protein